MGKDTTPRPASRSLSATPAATRFKHLAQRQPVVVPIDPTRAYDPRRLAPDQPGMAGQVVKRTAAPVLLASVGVGLGTTSASADPVSSTCQVGIGAGQWRAPLVGDYRITSNYGMRMHPIDKVERMHSGVDLVADNRAVLAASDGVVVRSGPYGGLGKSVEIKHANGVSTIYGHLAEIGPDITPGTQITAGQPLGVEGATGNVTGVHLHFEVRVNGQSVDPLAFMQQQRAPLSGQGSSAVVPAAAVAALPTAGTPRKASLVNQPIAIPANVMALYTRAAQRYQIPWTLLAGIGMAESNHGTNVHESSAGARGLMQFMPATWAAMAVDGDGDGKVDVNNPADSIMSAANYLTKSGARGGPDGIRNALYAYNHADWYVNDVLFYSAAYGSGAAAASAVPAVAPVPLASKQQSPDPKPAKGAATVKAKLDKGLVWANQPAYLPPAPGTQRKVSKTVQAKQIPPTLLEQYVAASQRFNVPWTLLAGIGMAESAHGTAPAAPDGVLKGLMRLAPATLDAVGVDGDQDGTITATDDADAISSAANYLTKAGVGNGPTAIRRALFAYNHSASFVDDVLYYARYYGGGSAPADTATYSISDLATGETDPVAAQGGGDPSGCLPVAGPQAAIGWAKQHLGDAYQMGAVGPSTWDCSSFTREAFRQAGIELPRTSQQQRDWLAAGHGTRVKPGQEKAGDLVFYNSHRGRSKVGHVIVVTDPRQQKGIAAQGTKYGVDYQSYAKAQRSKPLFEIWRINPDQFLTAPVTPVPEPVPTAVSVSEGKHSADPEQSGGAPSSAPSSQPSSGGKHTAPDPSSSPSPTSTSAPSSSPTAAPSSTPSPTPSSSSTSAPSSTSTPGPTPSSTAAPSSTPAPTGSKTAPPVVPVNGPLEPSSYSTQRHVKTNDAAYDKTPNVQSTPSFAG